MAAEERDLDLGQDTAALLAHELRGPLTVIRGYLDLLARPLDEEERLAAVAAVRRATDRLERMVADIAEGRGPTCPARLDIKRVRLRELVGAIAVDWSATTGRQIIVEATDDPVVGVDSQRIEAMLGNLLANAGKYSPAESAISVRISATAETATIAVDDEGPGIPVDERARVLGRYERLDRDRQAPGSGLGLAVVREIAGAHGGGVTIAESPSGGASIRVDLPRLG